MKKKQKKLSKNIKVCPYTLRSFLICTRSLNPLLHNVEKWPNIL